MSATITSTPPPAATTPLVSVVVPTYRERENLEELVQRITASLQRLEELFEIIVVDDASQDGTDEEVCRLHELGYPVRLIERKNERGLSSAVLRGFQEARGDLLVCMDADLSHPPEALPRLLEPIRQQAAEMVFGSRYTAGGSTEESWGRFRQWNSRVATWLARPFTDICDPMAGFFAIPRAVFQRSTGWDPVGYKIALEVLVKAGCRRVTEIPIHFADRRRGSSKLNLREQLNYVRHLGRLAKFKYASTFQFLRFAVVGASGAVVDLLIYAALLSSGVAIPSARALAIGGAMLWNFLGHRHWTFACTKDQIFHRFCKYLLACGFGAAVNYATTLIATACSPGAAEYPLMWAMVGVAFGAVTNFVLARNWVFAEHTPYS